MLSSQTIKLNLNLILKPVQCNNNNNNNSYKTHKNNKRGKENLLFINNNKGKRN